MRAIRWMSAFLALGVQVSCAPPAGAVDASLPPGDAGGPTWSGIYTDYFGPDSPPHCGTGPGCHESATAAGGVASRFVCVDQAACFDSLTGSSNLVRARDTTNPSGAALFRSLRQPGGSGRMPSMSTYTFQAADIARMQAWIARGAPND